MTGFPNGASSFGVPNIPGFGNVFGNPWFVNGNLGAAIQSGDARDAAKLTLTAALAAASSGDTIYVIGNITENIVAPAGLFAITIEGIGVPRHADAHTGNNGYVASTWKASSQTDPLLQVRQQGWTVKNMLLDAPTSDAAIEYIRDAASGNSERDSSHSRVLNCRFAAGATGILITGTENVFDVEVSGCVFNDLTNAIIGDPAYRWNIHHNVFAVNTNHIDSGFKESAIHHNTIGKFTTKSIDLTGGNSNMIYANALFGTYSNVGGYTAGTADEWGGNFNSLSGGITAADPA